MEKHFKYSDAEFEKRFAEGAIDPADFSHEAHLRLAWIHIRKYGVEKAEAHSQSQLKNYVEFVGAKDKYNTTLTIAAIRAVDHFMRQSETNHFKAFIQEFPRLKYQFKELMACHYGFDIFTSEEAKRTFLEPDLLPFDPPEE